MSGPGGVTRAEMRRQRRDEMGFPEDEYDLLAVASGIPALDEDDEG